MSLLDYDDIFWLVLGYADFDKQLLFEHYLGMSDVRMCHKVLQHHIAICVTIDDMASMLKNNMYDAVKAFLKRQPFDFDLSCISSSLDSTINEILQTIAGMPDSQWLVDLVAPPAMLQLIHIALKQFSLIENLNNHRLVLNLFYAQAPFDVVVGRLANVLPIDFFNVMTGCLRRQDEFEIKAIIQFLEANTTLLCDKDLMKRILFILLHDPLPHFNVVKWLIQVQKVPALFVAKVARYGDQDLFLEAQQLCTEKISSAQQEDIFMEALRSKNWDFVRYMSQQYGSKIIQDTLWFPASCGFLEWLQICWDENLADFREIADRHIPNMDTLKFLQKLMAAFPERFLPDECASNKKRKLQ